METLYQGFKILSRNYFDSLNDVVSEVYSGNGCCYPDKNQKGEVFFHAQSSGVRACSRERVSLTNATRPPILPRCISRTARAFCPIMVHG